MKIGIRLIALLLSLLLLCSCAGAETAEPTPSVTPQLASTPEATPSPTPTPAPAPEATPKITDGISAAEAQKNISAYFELYTLLDPDAYIGPSGWAGYAACVEVNAYGPDLPKLEASGILPDCVILNYDENQLDPRIAHDIPREPESELSFENGVTLRMERSVYPIFPEYVRYTMESETEYIYGELDFVYKYVGGEWVPVPQNNASTAMGYYLQPGEPKTFGIQTAQWLGEGLYRIVRSGEIYVEFVVSADAEPLEPLENTQEWNRNHARNFFYQLELPENCVNSLTGRVDWPREASTCAADFNYPFSNEEMAELLLGEGYSYDTASGTYSAGDKTLSFEDGISLTDNSPEVRALKLAYPYCATEYTPTAFQELGICKEQDNGAWYNVESHFPELWAVFGGGAGSFDDNGYAVSRAAPGFSSLNYNLDLVLEHLRSNMSGEAFEADYGDLTVVYFSNGSSYEFWDVRLKTRDAVLACCTNKSSDAFSGPEIYFIRVNYELKDLVIKNAPAAIYANDDAAPVITPYEAAAAVLPELYKIEGAFALVAAEFSYAYHNGDLSTLRPTWIFTAAYETVSPYDESITVENYLHFAVDALTGQLVEPHTEM